MVADLLIDRIELGDADQRLDHGEARDGRLVEAAALMAQAERELDLRRAAERAMLGTAVELHHEGEPSEVLGGKALLALGRIDVGDRARIGVAPRPAVTGKGPKLAGGNSTASGFEHGCSGFVGEQPRAALQFG